MTCFAVRLTCWRPGVNTNHKGIAVTIVACSCAGPSVALSNSSYLPPLPPAPPGHVTVIVNATTAMVTWQASGADGGVSVWYYVQKASSPLPDDDAPAWTIDETVTAPCCVYTFTGLSATLEYMFTVYAGSDGGNSSNSSPAIAVPGTAKPVAPMNVTAVSHRANEVTLTWSPVSDDLSVNGGSPITEYTCAGYYKNGTAVRCHCEDCAYLSGNLPVSDVVEPARWC